MIVFMSVILFDWIIESLVISDLLDWVFQGQEFRLHHADEDR